MFCLPVRREGKERKKNMTKKLLHQTSSGSVAADRSGPTFIALNQGKRENISRQSQSRAEICFEYVTKNLSTFSKTETFKYTAAGWRQINTTKWLTFFCFFAVEWPQLHVRVGRENGT